jgi:hypothetical protein
MSAFDVQVKKVLDTWSTKVPWQSGTDGQLLQEFYEIYQKWGMMTLIPAFSAVSHIFRQDVQKTALIDTALEEVAALRKAVKEAENKAAEETKETPGGPGKEITKEMVLDKIKENQTLRLQQAQAVVQGMEAEIGLARQGQDKIDFEASLVKARQDRLLCSQALTVGWVGYTQPEMQEAMLALSTATPSSNLTFLDSLLAPQQKILKTTQKTDITQADALKVLKLLWCQLVRAVILQNGQKGVGAVKYPDTEKTLRGSQVLTSLAHDELSETINMKCMEGEGIGEYTYRLQQRERYVRWMLSVLLQTTEEMQVLQLADTQFFKLLKTALPESMQYMGHASFCQGFADLASSILEITAGAPQTNAPKLITERHRGVNFKSPTKSQNPANRDDDVEDDGHEFAHGKRAVLISLLEEIQDTLSQTDNRRGTSNSKECFSFIKTGACRRGDGCKFEHPEGEDIPPPYPTSSSKRHRSDSPRSTQGERDCEAAKRTGVCEDRHCPDYHGQFDDRAVEICRRIQDGRPCYHQWFKKGCSFNHITETRQVLDRRHDGRGSGRADRFRG